MSKETEDRMKVLRIICDECGAEKGATNHWRMVIGGTSYIEFTPWNDANDTHPRVLHVCGQKCAHAVLDRWMSTGKLEKSSKEETCSM